MTMVAQIDAGDTNSRIYNIALRHTSGATRTMYLHVELQLIMILTLMEEVFQQ